MNKIDRIIFFNLITGGDSDAADKLFEDIFGITDRYDEFFEFYRISKDNAFGCTLVF